MKNILKKSFELLMPELAKNYYFRVVNSTNLSELSKEKIIEPELLYITRIIEQGKVVIDIGANLGEYLYILEKSNKFTDVIGIEPNQKLSQRLKKLFPKCKVFNLAISNTNENKKLKIPLINGKYFDSRATFEDFTDVDEVDQMYIDVQSQTLDRFVQENLIKNIGLIKIDVEGHEVQVIESACQTIERERPILLVEIEQRHHKYPITDIFDKIVSYDYRGYIFSMELMQLLELKDFAVSKYQQISCLKTEKYLNNFLFIPNESYLTLNSLNSMIDDIVSSQNIN